MQNSDGKNTTEDLDNMSPHLQEGSDKKSRPGAFQTGDPDGEKILTVDQSKLASMVRGMNSESPNDRSRDMNESKSEDYENTEGVDFTIEGRDRSAASAISLNDISSFGFAKEKPFTYEEERTMDDVDKQVLEFMAARMSVLKETPALIESGENSGEMSKRVSFASYTKSPPNFGSNQFLSPESKPTHHHQRLSVMDQSKTMPARSLTQYGNFLQPAHSIDYSAFEEKEEPIIQNKLSMRENTWIDDVENKLVEQSFSEIKKKHHINKELILKKAYQRTRGYIPQDSKKKMGLIANALKKKTAGTKKAEEVKVPDKKLLDIFDQKERAFIKKLKSKIPNTFKSVFEEDQWQDNGIAPVMLAKAQRVFEVIKGQFSGTLTTFSISPDCKSLYMAATDSGEVVEVDISKRTVKKEKLGKRVNCLDISADNQLWIAGLETGEVFVKKSYGSWISKRLFVENQPIRSVRFADNETVIASTSNNVMKLTVKDLKVMLDVEKSVIIQNKSETVTGISIMPVGALNNLIVSTTSSVSIHLLATPIEELMTIVRPEQISSDTLPSVSWMFPEDKLFQYLLIAWDDHVFLYKLQGPACILCGMKPMSQRIKSCAVLRNRMILLIMENSIVHLETIQSLFAKHEYGGGFSKTFALHETDMNRYSLFKADNGKQVKGYNETIKAYRNTLFFLRDNSISNIYLMGFDELVNIYKQRGEWKKALKLCIELCSGKIKSNQEEQAVIKGEIKMLTREYLGVFVDLNAQPNEFQVQVINTCIDAMLVSENSEFLFSTLKQRLDPGVFWPQIEVFIQSGVIEKLGLNLLKEAVLYLTGDIGQHLIFDLSDQEILSNMEDISELFNAMKKRKLWQAMYRVSLLLYQQNLHATLSMILTDLMCYEDCANELLQKCKNTENEIAELAENNSMMSYMRMFWFIKTIVNWNVGSVINKFDTMEDIWIKTVEWLMDPSSIKVLMLANSNLYLEIYFDLFLNVDFNNSATIGHSLKQRLTNIKNAMDGIVPKDSHKEQDNSQDLSTTRDTNEDELADTDNFITFKAIVESLLQFSDENKRVEIYFLALKLISLSVFKQILNDSAFVKDVLFGLLSVKFADNRLWFNYEPISKQDFEEKVVRIADQFQKTMAFDRESKKKLGDLAIKNEFFRVNAFMVEITKGPIEAYHQYFNSVKHSSPGHLFMWMKKAISESKTMESKAELCFEIMKDLDKLVPFVNRDLNG